MTTKIPPFVKPQQAIRTLERLGFVKVGARGSHVRLKHPDGRWTQVAVHPRPIPKGTLRAILRQAEIPLDEFLKNL
ncbi:hypothetical protein CO015_05480 [candidate division WWE3 bacterium CG_4_8_14_3_um_filter_42_11]|uniref:Type II toxin-antitoxin system HicA family toxin n=2 Tax=Katanobacteria TaxID=422282 RepID=A0A2M7WZ44_UNCKA|nr:MAG: hypothetical protein CO181_00030 [candidate division WWE3 bacterium CG_4_9_14_3_um_filter_43_9]PJC68034.1 MAG: hypothetical protein CO015_05480 [candidate division WWE3 bacterium CG_4_8_14_3_um_filter_42_11]